MRSFLEWLRLDETKRIPNDAIKINLPKVEQTTSYSCGAAAMRAVAGYFGVGPDSEDEFIELLRTSEKNGTNPTDLLRVARMLGLHAFGRQHMTIDSLKARLAKKIPVICALQAWGASPTYQKDVNGHYVVAIGFDDEKIYFEDPVLRETRGFLTYREFLDRWHDVDGNGKKYERFGLAVWRVAPPDDVSDKNKANVIESKLIE